MMRRLPASTCLRSTMRRLVRFIDRLVVCPGDCLVYSFSFVYHNPTAKPGCLAYTWYINLFPLYRRG